MLEDLLQRRPYNAAADFVDANVARGLGDKIAFTDPDRSFTYGELQSRTLPVCGGAEGARVAPGRAAPAPPARHGRFSGRVLGRGARRRRALPLNTLLTAEHMPTSSPTAAPRAGGRRSAGARPSLPILDRLPRAAHGGAGGRDVPTDKAAFPGRDVHDFDELLAREQPEPFTAPTVSDEVAFWMYTSGSTGDPKGVKHVHTTPMAAARLMGRQVIGIREDDVVFSAAKLFFSYGMGNAMAFPMSVGASTVLLPRDGRRPTRCSRSCAATARPSSTACRRSMRRCSRTRT